MPPSIRLRLLGPLAIEMGGVPVRIGMGNERALVALLALHAPTPVSSERIVDALWRDHPPASAREMVRIYVGRIRKHLGELIATHPGGYALEVDPEDVDALRFERLGSEAAGLLERGDAQAALKRFNDALELWTGDVLPELPELPFVDEARGRLEEAQLTAVEGRIGAHLALGRSATLISELEGVVQAHPYREGFRGQLMLALYRAGRQIEALEQYQEARRLLVETAGVEPGPDLRRLQKGILEHDPALRSRSDAEQDGSPPRPRRSIARIVSVLSILLVVLAAGGFAVFGPGSTTNTIGPSSLGRLGADGRTRQLFRIGGPAGPLVSDGKHVWVGEGSRQALLELDAKRLRPIRSLHLPSFPYRLVLDGNAVWASVGYTGTIARIDARGVTTLRPEPRSTGRVQLASDGSTLWAASQDGVVVALQPSSLRRSLLVRHAGRPEALIAALGSVWLAEATSDGLLRIVPRAQHDAQRIPIPIGGVAEELAADKRSLWALTPLEDRLWRVDPRRNVVTASIDVGPRSTSLAILGNTVWVGAADGRILAVDPRRNQVVRTIQAGGPVDDLTPDGSSLLVATR